ncbi:TetR/AcrR family transcriptional regulator [Actinomadura sp. 6N118]|uniref:TetR/AcrR family transcriptional regulator n=1 Tax=Actinomadura sp. 6N118 TaxID=3375151 RepID=UPI0037993ABD
MPPPRSAHQPRKTPRQQRAWRTRARILAAAAHVFAEHGYASGTTDRIAEQAGLSIGSLYQYFPNKDAILVTLAQAHLDDTIQAIRTHLTQPQSLEQWLPAVTGALVDLHVDNPRLHQVLFEQAPRPPELLAQFHQAEQEAVTLVAKLLREDPGVQVPDPDAAARYVVAIIESLIHRFIGHIPGSDHTALTGQIVYIVTRYLS